MTNNRFANINPAILLFVFSLALLPSAYAGLPEWGKLPHQDEAIKLEQNLGEEFWIVQGIKIDPTTYDPELLNKFTSKYNGLKTHENHLHEYVCMNNQEKYLYVYDSGWGPGYGLTDKPYEGFYNSIECSEIRGPIELDSGIDIGAKKEEIEKMFSIDNPGDVADLRLEEILPYKNCKKGIWHTVHLKIIFSDEVVSGVFMDDHAEPYDDPETCK